MRRQLRENRSTCCMTHRPVPHSMIAYREGELFLCGEIKLSTAAKKLAILNLGFQIEYHRMSVDWLLNPGAVWCDGHA